MKTKTIHRHVFSGRVVSPTYACANPRLVKTETVPTKKAPSVRDLLAEMQAGDTADQQRTADALRIMEPLRI